jgi:hypothetical protein
MMAKEWQDGKELAKVTQSAMQLETLRSGPGKLRRWYDYFHWHAHQKGPPHLLLHCVQRGGSGLLTVPVLGR